MQNKFRQPVSMQVTKEQYEKDLREPLLRMGYKEVCEKEWEDMPILVTNFGNTIGEVSNTSKLHKENYNRHFIDHYNPKLFLAIAAMSNIKYGIYGEWWYCIKDVKMKGSGKVEYNRGKLYMGLGNERIINNSRVNNHYWRGSYRFNYFRKVTLQELITYFTKQKQENIMKKEITTELIEGLKNLIAPENVEQFNKLMGIEKPLFKKEDFITGDKVVLRNGDTYLVIRDCNGGKYGAQVFVLLQCAKSEGFMNSAEYEGFMNSAEYDDKLNDKDRVIEYDIMKIYRYREGGICSTSISNDLRDYNLIWSRE